jgi:hypothetical protein
VPSLRDWGVVIERPGQGRNVGIYALAKGSSSNVRRGSLLSTSVDLSRKNNHSHIEAEILDTRCSLTGHGVKPQWLCHNPSAVEWIT